MEQIIIHVDMDAFYASVEIRDDPSLKGKPLIIGSLPNERGVVSTCSYEARSYGVRSGMNIKEAYRLCPNGIYMHPNFDKYRETSARLHEIWNFYSSASEYIALDEAFLDVTERARDWEGARRIADIIKRRTKDELHLTCSIGVAYSKTAAKTASEEKKPDGYFEIRDPKAYMELLNDRDVRALYTVGPKTAEKLRRSGISTVRDVRNNRDSVVSLLGKQGEWLVQLANGIDDRKVTPYRPEDAKSISREITFQQDVDDFGFLREVMLLLALSVESRAQRVGLHGKGVSIKITYSDMKSITRSKSPVPCETAIEIYREALKLLEQVDEGFVRLVGVGIYNLSDSIERQISFENLLKDTDLMNDDNSGASEAKAEDVSGSSALEGEAALKKELRALSEHYKLDFAGNLDKIRHLQTLHRTVEYMRKHR